MNRSCHTLLLVLGCAALAACDRGRPTGEVQPAAASPTTAPALARPIDAPAPAKPVLRLLLRSAPTGAAVTIDGVEVGVTPTVYEMPAGNKDVEFVFRAPGFVPATYRFIPVVSGEVFGRLQPDGVATAASP